MVIFKYIYLSKNSFSAINFLKSNKNDNNDDDNWTEDMTAMTSLNGDDTVDDSSQGFDSRSNRISFRNAAQKVNYFRQKQSLSADNTSYDAQTDRSLDNNNISLIQNYLPPKRLLHLLDVREGARRFAFLLETCKPGEVPDAPLLSALTELVSFRKPIKYANIKNVYFRKPLCLEEL